MVPENVNNVGAGIGGGPDPADTANAAEGTYKIRANQILLLGRPPLPPAKPDDSVVTVLASNLVGTEGMVNVRGAKGVRVTAGPPPLPPIQSSSTDGVEILTGETGKITLQRGLLPVDQKMEMAQAGITIDAGSGKVTIQSLTEITLSVANGMTKIKLGPEGITIEALQIKLSAQVLAEIQGLVNKISGSAVNQISGGITMIG